MANMMDPKIMVKEQIFQTKINICKKDDYISRTPGPNAQSAVDKKHCLQTLLGKLQNCLSEMELIDTQNAANPGMGYALKSKKYWEVMKNNDNCD
jgi:hypothetical protein